jgi:hypothetical protein
MCLFICLLWKNDSSSSWSIFNQVAFFVV